MGPAPSRRTMLASLAATAGAVALGTSAVQAHPVLPIPGTAPRTNEKRRPGPTIFVAGDSTASVYAHSERPRAGWGQALPLFLGPQAGVYDYALSGASSKSYADAGLLDEVLGMLQHGDYLLISFGHNDAKTDDPNRGTDPATTFKDYLRRYIDGAAARGAKPVLITPVERRRFDAFGTRSEERRVGKECPV